MLHPKLERILPRVQKPSRYVGGEKGCIIKDKNQVDLRFAFCFPDTYEIGMSHLGSRILYGLLNDQEGIWCERCFAPWIDMEAEMRQAGIELYGLESGDSLREFDVIGFTLQYEMSYTNLLNMLDLAGIPLRWWERSDDDPLVFMGGPCAYNPEPLADFADVFLIGEGEEMNMEFYQVWADHLRAHNGKMNKKELLDEVVKIPGVYIPRF